MNVPCKIYASHVCTIMTMTGDVKYGVPFTTKSLIEQQLQIINTATVLLNPATDLPS